MPSVQVAALDDAALRLQIVKDDYGYVRQQQLSYRAAPPNMEGEDIRKYQPLEALLLRHTVCHSTPSA
jgi:hypothetical protein